MRSSLWRLLVAFAPAFITLAASAQPWPFDGPRAQANDYPDIDVLYIERTPRLSFNPNDMTYSSGLPSLGQAVTYRAHIKNWGPVAQDVEYLWYFDGVPGPGGTVQIPAGQTVQVNYAWNWDPADHDLKIVVDPNGLLTELTKLNNIVETRTNALLVGLWVEQGLYDYFHENQYKLNDGANGFEDWGQRMVRRWNEMHAKAKFPFCPNGALDRMSLDKVVVVPNGALPLNGGLATNNPDRLDRTVDMMWGYPYNPNDILPGTFYGFRWSGPFLIDMGSIHEMNHARFMIDNYGFDVHQSESEPWSIDVRDDDGKIITGTKYMPFIAWQGVHYDKWSDIMGGPAIYDAYTACVWNWKHHKRGRGNQNSPPDIGVFLTDLPQNSHFQFIDENGVPLVGATVDVYRATGGTGWYAKTYDNVSDATFTTDANGFITMPQNPFGSPIRHTYGLANTVMILKIRHHGELYFTFQEITDFNLAYWRGNTTNAYYLRQVDLRDNPATVPNNAWLGNYFNGTNYQAFVTSRTDGTIDFETAGALAPGLDEDNVSVFWHGNFTFTDGWKRFTITTDGGVQLYVDERLVFDAWDNTSLNTFTPDIYTTNWSSYVNPGQASADTTRHRVAVRYRHGTGTARIEVSWTDQPPPEEIPYDAWRADLYSQKNLTGYITSRLEDRIDHEYDTGSPDPAINGDNWSVRRTGYWYFPAGTYLFTATTDDGMRIWSDDALVLNKWFDQNTTTYTFTQEMDEGYHLLRVEHYENGSSATAKLSWELQTPVYGGEVTLGHWSAPIAGVQLNLLVGTSQYTVTLDAEGKFSMPGSIPAGTYDVKLWGRAWLRKTAPAVTFPLTETLSFSLTNGDCQVNNAVDIGDITRVLITYGRADETADLDGVGGVTLSDLNIVLINFGQQGDP